MFVVDADLNRCGGYYYYIIVIVISLHSDEMLIIENKTIHTNTSVEYQAYPYSLVEKSCNKS